MAAIKLLNFLRWDPHEIANMIYYWFKNDGESQCCVAYRHHLRTGKAWVDIIEGKEVYQGRYRPPQSMIGKVMK